MKVWQIAWREFLETVRTKAFFLTTILLPAVIIGLIYGSELVMDVASESQKQSRKIAIIDETGVLEAELIKRFAAHNAANPNSTFEVVDPNTDDPNVLAQQIEAGELYAYLELPAGALDFPADPNEPTGPLLARKDAQLTATRQVRNVVRQAFAVARLQMADPPIDPNAVLAIQASAPGLRSLDVGTGEESTGNMVAQLMTPFAFMFLMFMGTFGISQSLLTSLIEEKSTRVVEVLLSAVSPLQLMAGKILGLVGVGLLLLTIWGATAYLGARSQDMAYLVTEMNLFYALIYFIPGFLMFAALLGGIGAACNTLKEAQSMTFPVSLVTIIPMILWFPLVEHPQSPLSVSLSFVPLITPFVMILRLSADPGTPLWQILATQALLWVTVVAMIWLAAKIFRVGVLMYGKPPTLRELGRWLRAA